MAYEGNPADYKTKPDMFSLQGLIAWLESQHPNEEYDYGSCKDCLLAQYFGTLGIKYEPAFPPRDHGTDLNALEWIAAYPGNPSGWKFGLALSRAKQLLAEQSS